MRVPDSELTDLLANYGRLSRRLAVSNDKIGDDWPARAAMLAEVVIEARNRVEMKALTS